MGYKVYKLWIAGIIAPIKQYLTVTFIHYINVNMQADKCTNRPALYPKGEISRNKVDVMEIVSKANNN